MIFNNLFKVLYNIGHIIWYKIHMVCLHLIDVELPIPSQFNTINNDIPNPIDKNDDLVNDYIDSWYEDEHRPYCETP
mgnify:CR=1 FL=1